MSYFFFEVFFAAFFAGFFAAFFFAAINAYLLLLKMWTRGSFGLCGVVRHGQDDSRTHLLRNPTDSSRTLMKRIPRRWRLIEMVRSLASGPLPLWRQPRAASPYKLL